MPKTLTLKLTLAFILVALITAALVAVFIRITSTDRLSQLVIDQQRSSMEKALADYYTQTGSWEGVQDNWFVIQRAAGGSMMAPPTNSAEGPGMEPRAINGRNLFGLADSSGVLVVPVEQGIMPGVVVSRRELKGGTVISVSGQQVGTLLTAGRFPGFNVAESMFLARTNQGLILAVFAALLVALLIGLVLARTLTRPLAALKTAAENVAAGDLQQQVEVRSNDEIGQLAQAFNRMSQEVARVNQLRRQMTADVAHDLRTPLTVIAGYIESMRDGVLAPSPERLGIIYGEIERLQNLVSDLRVLSQADTGELQMNLEALDLRPLLERSAATFQHRAEQQGVELILEAAQDLPVLNLDEARLLQVMDNLLSNALRYTPRGGRIIISGAVKDQGVEICVSDTGSGIPADVLPHIFERFQRGDPSRHTEMGESGLGLAIVRAIIEAHHGSVSAESTHQAGTSIRILLPLD